VLILREKKFLVNGQPVKLYSLDGKAWFSKAHDVKAFRQRRARYIAGVQTSLALENTAIGMGASGFDPFGSRQRTCGARSAGGRQWLWPDSGGYGHSCSAKWLSNISTRGPLLTADNVMIGGFIIEGSVAKTVFTEESKRPSCSPHFFLSDFSPTS